MTERNENGIWTKQLSFRYAAATEAALSEVSLSIKEGECVVLCGLSGCGKTTFLRMLNGLIPELFEGELSGEGLCQGKHIGATSITERVRQVGSVFQNPKTQYFNVDTTSELAFPCENAGLPSEEIQKRIDDCAELLELSELLGRNIFQLSGGEKQRIAFGAACMLSPSLLVLDEPTSNLDGASVRRLHQLIKIMKQRGVTIVMAEHRLAWLCDLADRYLYFAEGRLKEVWEGEALREKEEGYLEERGLRPLCIQAYQRRVKEKEGVQSDEWGALLSARGLVIGYGKKPVRDVSSFQIHQGELLCLMGENGTGKSTLVKTLCGLQKPLSGVILWEGEPAKERKRIADSYLVMQDVNYQLFADSVREEVLLGSRHAERCEEVLSALGLLELADRHPMSLSGGQKQRVAIAAAMLSGKRFLVLDEPTSGLDFYHMTQVARLLQQLKKEGAAVLVVTHDEELAALCADRVMRLG